MKLKGAIRSLDMFGDPVGLQMAGKSTFPTIGGGLATAVLKLFSLSFFCKQLIALVNYEDPQINSFTVLDNRESMTEVSAEEYGLEIYFYFTTQFGQVLPLDPSIGRFGLFSTHSIYSAESGVINDNTELETVEIDFMKKNDTILWFNNTPTRGVFTAVDPNQLKLNRIWEAFDKTYINMTFIECQPSEGQDCQSEEEIESFLEQNYLLVVTSETAIDFESVLPKEETLVKQPKIEFWERIGTRKDGARTFHKHLKEHKVEL